MKRVTSVFFVVTLLSLTLAIPPPASTLTPQGETILVTSNADSGPGTLRQALLDAQKGDVITFDPTVFPPSAPVTISVNSELPHIRQGNLTMDASNAGVILDGSNATGTWVCGLQIVSSDANTIQGVQVAHFSGAGIAISGVWICEGTNGNVIGPNNVIAQNRGPGITVHDHVRSDNRWLVPFV